MTTATKKTPRKSVTASQHRNGVHARDNGKGSREPVAPPAAAKSTSCEPVRPSYYDTLSTEHDKAEKDTKQRESSAFAVPKPIPDIGAIEKAAGLMRDILEGPAAPSGPPKSALIKPSTQPAVVGDEFLAESVPIAVFNTVLRQTLKIDADPDLIRNYLDNMAEDCGVGDDPLGRSLVEELAALKLVVGNLHSQSMICKEVADIVAITAAACTTAAEMRRIVMALNDLRKYSGYSRKPDAKSATPADKKIVSDKPICSPS